MSIQDTTALLAQLVAIDSRNPSLGEGPGETQIAAFVAKLLTQHGFDVALVEPTPGRPSVFARLAGTGGGKSLLLNGHLDTVGFGDMVEPLTPRQAYGRLYGRGSYDMKSGLAALLAAGIELAARPRMPGDLLIAAVADEEYASLGTEAILAHMAADRIRADYGLVAEPTDHGLCIAHKGFVWATITTQGRAAHGSAWEEGIDAIMHMGRILVALEYMASDLRLRPHHRLVGPPSLHASLIQGGVELSTYPGRCVLQLERRTLPGETPARVENELRSMLIELSNADPNFIADLEIGLTRSSMEADQDSLFVQTVREITAQYLDQPAPFYGMAAWTDAALMADAGIPSILFGPSGNGAHASEEYADSASVALCAKIYADIAQRLCGG